MAILPHPFDDRDGDFWWNGAFVPARGAHLNILTHGLHYGSAVFEGLRVYDGRIFKLHEHSQRLIDSGRMLDMAVPYTADELDAATIATVKREGVRNGYIRPIAWRGSEMMAISAQHTKIHVAIATWEIKTYYPPELLENGVRLAWASYARPAPNTAPTASKAAGLYMICTISKHEAERNGYQDAVMLDWRGQLAETTSANLFLVQNGELHTPTPDCFLNGITRQTVMELARRNGIKVVERALFPDDLRHTQEVFVTGTAAELTPVACIGEHIFKPAAVTKLLRDAYKAETATGVDAFH
jgi:branched-chain amino acid aminotransferase